MVVAITNYLFYHCQTYFLFEAYFFNSFTLTLVVVVVVVVVVDDDDDNDDDDDKWEEGDV